jgi:hypothetical protein
MWIHLNHGDEGLKAFFERIAKLGKALVRIYYLTTINVQILRSLFSLRFQNFKTMTFQTSKEYLSKQQLSLRLHPHHTLKHVGYFGSQI